MLRWPVRAQVIGPAQERVMAANQRSQGEDRIFLTPQMLQVKLEGRRCRAAHVQWFTWVLAVAEIVAHSPLV